MGIGLFLRYQDRDKIQSRRRQVVEHFISIQKCLFISPSRSPRLSAGMCSSKCLQLILQIRLHKAPLLCHCTILQQLYTALWTKAFSLNHHKWMVILIGIRLLANLGDTIQPLYLKSHQYSPRGDQEENTDDVRRQNIAFTSLGKRHNLKWSGQKLRKCKPPNPVAGQNWTTHWFGRGWIWENSSHKM